MQEACVSSGCPNKVQAVLTKYRKLCGLSNRNLFLTVLDIGHPVQFQVKFLLLACRCVSFSLRPTCRETDRKQAVWYLLLFGP